MTEICYNLDVMRYIFISIDAGRFVCLSDKLYCTRLPVLDHNSKYFYCGS